MANEKQAVLVVVGLDGILTLTHQHNMQVHDVGAGGTGNYQITKTLEKVIGIVVLDGFS